MAKTEENITTDRNLLSTDNPVFCCYCFWGSILIIKMLLMSILTAMRRFRKKSFVNPEDLALNKVTEPVLNDPDVERVRRAHLNDLENIMPFMLIALAYIAVGPKPLVARLLIRFFALARILHTIVYAFRPIPQPIRAIVFFIGFFITLYMAFYAMIKTIVYI
ncbi:microsomal glutathione S-transferase 1-like [Lucilia cuprina]|uniref:microsomal glutathione S-transferase 1-like n=1 Tax=Lucilia cuprina TaxID=7375 RepID=UPI000C71B8A5|nr:microsomal glutathione S-transferase 1-like [Lucilia cuprina]